jgi:protein-L-isoaspartate(D-aspartate) O-methyltransferase
MVWLLPHFWQPTNHTMHTTKEEMLQHHLKDRNINDPHVLRAMEEVDRVIFVPEELINRAYDDNALPIGKEQTISQPYVVAFMAQALDISPGDKILEVGTGCGYNAAVLARIADHVYSVEIIEWLADLARTNLERAGVNNVTTRLGDGYQGWPEKGPFDHIMLTAAAPAIPEPLKNQLRIGGSLLAPVGRLHQKLILLKKTGENEFEKHTLIPVQFVPMTGQAQQKKDE